VPVFSQVAVTVDQARREEVGRLEGDVPLGDEELMITGWKLTEDRLVPRPESDQEFPWRDPDYPLNRVYAPYADTSGSLHPAVTVRAARIGPRQRVLQQMAFDPQDRRLAIARQDWPEVRRSLEQEVADLVQATIEGRPMPPRIWPRILTAENLLPREREHLEGAYGAFLTEQALAAEGAQRPLGSNGRVLALYPAAVLDAPGAEERWQASHPAYPRYAVDVPRRSGTISMMSGEGYAGAAAFANTRTTEDTPPAIDVTPTGVNTLLVPFDVQLTLPPQPDGHQRTRWQPLIALIALDNLYGDHNPAGMVIADYGDSYLPLLRPPSPPVKADPGTPPA
jgi:hypothetical protein